MPFGLRNVGATYQRLVDKAFHKQIRRNLEVYVDDLVIKSRTKDEIVRDIEETFKTLRKINMKLNPKKCTFGVEEGMFLGYKVKTKGLKFERPEEGLSKSSDGSGTKNSEQDFVSGAIPLAQMVPEQDWINPPHKPRRKEFTLCPKIRVGEELKEKSISEVEILAVVEEEGDTWMTPIFEYLMEETLPADVKKARAVRRKLQRMHAGIRSVVEKALRIGYYWPTMHKDAMTLIRACQDYQVHKYVPRNPQQKLTSITSLWPFYKWGIDIAGPFPEGPRKVKFLIVAIDYFTKWIEAKPVATITGNQIKTFVWENIVCRFGLPGDIISDNGKQFQDNPF
ncbi:reverse transcriptase domain-containing protein [Tanacetum coccineum]